MMLIHTSQLCDTNSFAYRSCNGIRGSLAANPPQRMRLETIARR